MLLYSVRVEAHAGGAQGRGLRSRASGQARLPAPVGGAPISGKQVVLVRAEGPQGRHFSEVASRAHDLENGVGHLCARQPGMNLGRAPRGHREYEARSVDFAPKDLQSRGQQFGRARRSRSTRGAEPEAMSRLAVEGARRDHRSCGSGDHPLGKDGKMRATFISGHRRQRTQAPDLRRFFMAAGSD
jgi:hypothetical protein